VGGLACWLAALAAMAGMAALVSFRAGEGFRVASHVSALLAPASLGSWLTAAGVLVAGVFGGLGTAAVLVARRGLRAGTTVTAA
jgi:hypothetical protein